MGGHRPFPAFLWQSDTKRQRSPFDSAPAFILDSGLFLSMSSRGSVTGNTDLSFSFSFSLFSTHSARSVPVSLAPDYIDLGFIISVPNEVMRRSCSVTELY